MPASSRPSASRCVTAARSAPAACSTGIRAFSVPSARFVSTGSARRVSRATQAARSATPSRASTVVGASTGAAARDGAGWPAAATPAAPSGATSPVPSARWTKVRRRMWRYSSVMPQRALAARRWRRWRWAAGAAVAAAQPSGFSLVLRRSADRVSRLVVRAPRRAWSTSRGPASRAPSASTCTSPARTGTSSSAPAWAARQSRRGRLHHLPGPRDPGGRRHRRGLLQRLRAEGVAELGQVADRRAGGRRRLAGVHAAVLVGRGLRRQSGQLRVRRRRASRRPSRSAASR